MARDTFGSSVLEECGHKCSRPPGIVVSVNGCRDEKPLTSGSSVCCSERTGGSGREGKGKQVL